MNDHPSTDGNQLLARLPPDVLDRLRKHFRPTQFEVGKVLYEARATIEYAYFPTSGGLSAVVVMLDGSMIEVGTIGNEGGVGLLTSASGTISPNKVFVQVPGEGLRIETAVLEQESRQEGPLKQRLLNYHTAFLFQVSQSVACNGLHHVLQRCSRWLLMAHDHCIGDEIKLTHEFLGVMLGVRRASVTETLQLLQAKGYVHSTRGMINVTNRQGLENESCECYRLVREEYSLLLA